MRTLTPAFAAHVREPVTKLAVCWQVQKHNGELILGTQHDRDITITVSQHTIVDLTGVYRAQAAITGSDIRSSSDMSVDNMDVDGATAPASDSSGDVTLDVSVADIEAGLLDNAPVTVFLVNWASPDAGQAMLRRGHLGTLTRDSDGRYKTEVRGLSQLLSQQIGHVYQETCNVVRFGDARCRYDVDAIRIESPITAVVSNKHFSIAEPGTVPPAGYPLGGEVLFLSGENEGFTREVKVTTVAGGALTLELYEELPADVEIGDQIQVTPGCDRRWSTCRAYGNLLNFRGWGVYIPGTMAMLRGNTPGECEVPLPPTPDTTGPTAPTISASTGSSSTITISRTVNATDADGVLQYETQRSLAGAGTWTTFDTSTTNPLTASGLSPDTAYDFRQRGIDTLGNPGAYSTVSTASTSEGSSSEWEDVTVGMSALGAELATAGRKVRLDLTGSDYGLRLDTVNGASSSQLLTGAFDGSAAIELRPQTGSTINPDATYVGIANGADLWNGGSTEVAQVNAGFCIYYGSRYIDLAATAKVTGVVAAQSLVSEPSADARAAIFEQTYNGDRVFAVTASTIQSYHQPISGYFPEEGPDSDKPLLLGTTIDHGNDPPLVGQEWLYFEQEVDYRQDRGNPNGRNRLDVWSRDGYLGYLEIPLTHRPDWDFSYAYAAYYEYIGGLFNNPSTANADNFFRISHVIFANNRAKDDRIGPPPGFLT